MSEQNHTDHRKRMRNRFRENGLVGFAPHEILQLLLFYSRTRGNVNPLAHSLLEKFGTLKGVLEADQEQLLTVDGIGEESATFLSLIVPLFREYEKSLCEEIQTLKSFHDVEQYCKALFAGERLEHFYAICLDNKNRIITRKLIASGSLSEVGAYPRLVAEAALNSSASGIILAHNHPGGFSQPSSEDISATIQIQQMLAIMDITLIDHVIVAGNEVYSLTMHHNIHQQR